VIDIARIPKNHDEGVIDVTPMPPTTVPQSDARKLRNRRPAEAALRMKSFLSEPPSCDGSINVVAKSQRTFAFEGTADICHTRRNFRQ
jgi:hypothetical protein